MLERGRGEAGLASIIGCLSTTASHVRLDHLRPSCHALIVAAPTSSVSSSFSLL